jgi:hypothetical protein
MFKALIWFLFFYLIYKLIRNIFMPVRTGHQPADTHYNANPKNGKTEVFNVPENYRTRKKDDNNGEYIDYKDI